MSHDIWRVNFLKSMSSGPWYTCHLSCFHVSLLLTWDVSFDSGALPPVVQSDLLISEVSSFLEPVRVPHNHLDNSDLSLYQSPTSQLGKFPPFSPSASSSSRGFMLLRSQHALQLVLGQVMTHSHFPNRFPPQPCQSRQVPRSPGWEGPLFGLPMPPLTLRRPPAFPPV